MTQNQEKVPEYPQGYAEYWQKVTETISRAEKRLLNVLDEEKEKRDGQDNKTTPEQ